MCVNIGECKNSSKVVEVQVIQYGRNVKYKRKLVRDELELEKVEVEANNKRMDRYACFLVCNHIMLEISVLGIVVNYSGKKGTKEFHPAA